MATTSFFVSCKGVFQGGGCRGVALAGAYLEAHRCGVRFSEIAGTSAGSIVAALIGAGATPEQLMQFVSEMDYLSFMAPPKPLDFKKTWGTRFAGFLAEFRHPGLKAFFKNGGIYSSEKIEVWLDEKLHLLLPHLEGKITFADLPTPTYVVAADLVDRRPKVWSTGETPRDSVAFAVRASCSIPIFFQPVQEGNTLYVDGGTLSNLPLFV